MTWLQVLEPQVPSQRIHEHVWETLSLETSALKLLGKQTLTNKREVCSEFVLNTQTQLCKNNRAGSAQEHVSYRGCLML